MRCGFCHSGKVKSAEQYGVNRQQCGSCNTITKQAELKLTETQQKIINYLSNWKPEVVTNYRDVTQDLDQNGIARAIGISRSNISRIVRPLIDSNLVGQKKAHILDENKRTMGKMKRWAYYLTPAGKALVTESFSAETDPEYEGLNHHGDLPFKEMDKIYKDIRKEREYNMQHPKDGSKVPLSRRKDWELIDDELLDARPPLLTTEALYEDKSGNSNTFYTLPFHFDLTNYTSPYKINPNDENNYLWVYDNFNFDPVNPRGYASLIISGGKEEGKIISSQPFKEMNAESFSAENSRYYQKNDVKYERNIEGMICNCGNTSGWIVSAFDGQNPPEGCYNRVYDISCPSCHENMVTYQSKQSSKSPFKIVYGEYGSQITPAHGAETFEATRGEMRQRRRTPFYELPYEEESEDKDVNKYARNTAGSVLWQATYQALLDEGRSHEQAETFCNTKFFDRFYEYLSEGLRQPMRNLINNLRKPSLGLTRKQRRENRIANEMFEKYFPDMALEKYESHEGGHFMAEEPFICPQCRRASTKSKTSQVCVRCESEYQAGLNAPMRVPWPGDDGYYAETFGAGSFRDGTGCISKGSFPSMTCEYCGFDPHGLVYYQCKQNDEDLTHDEWKEQLEFYFYEGSHGEQCQGLIDENKKAKGFSAPTPLSPTQPSSDDFLRPKNPRRRPLRRKEPKPGPEEPSF